MVVKMHKNAPSTGLQIVSIDGLQQVIKCLLAQGVDCVTIKRCGEDQIEVPGLQRLEQIQPGLVGHVDVHENHIRRQFLNQPFRLFGTGCGLNDGDGRAGPADLATQEVSAMGLVVHDEGMKLPKHGRKV